MLNTKNAPFVLDPNQEILSIEDQKWVFEPNVGEDPLVGGPNPGRSPLPLKELVREGAEGDPKSKLAEEPASEVDTETSKYLSKTIFDAVNTYLTLLFSKGVVLSREDVLSRREDLLQTATWVPYTFCSENRTLPEGDPQNQFRGQDTKVELFAYYVEGEVVRVVTRVAGNQAVAGVWLRVG